MKNTLTESGFRDEFNQYGRGEQFSYEGLGALFNYLEQLEEDCDMEIEMDVIGLCCDFSEYTIKGVMEDYGAESFQEIEDNTAIIYIDELNNYRDIDDEDNLDCRIIIQNY